MNRQSNTVIQAAAKFQEAAARALQADHPCEAAQPGHCRVERDVNGVTHLRAADLASAGEVRSTLAWLQQRHAPSGRILMRCRRTSDGRFSLRAAVHPAA